MLSNCIYDWSMFARFRGKFLNIFDGAAKKISWIFFYIDLFIRGNVNASSKTQVNYESASF